MPKIVPVSDLRNYAEVLQQVNRENPVFLTRNGRGRYVIVDIDEYEEMSAFLRLRKDILKGYHSSINEDLTPLEDVEREFLLNSNEVHEN